MPDDYCRAYQLADLQAFPGWADISVAEGTTTETDIVYLRSDFTVVRNPVLHDAGVLVATVTDQWRRFCVTQLNFGAP